MRKRQLSGAEKLLSPRKGELLLGIKRDKISTDKVKAVGASQGGSSLLVQIPRLVNTSPTLLVLGGKGAGILEGGQ